MEGHLRAHYERTLPDGSKEFVASSAGEKRDGLTLLMQGALLENYLKNPVVLWAHDYRGEHLPIGKALKVKPMAKEMRATLQFDLEDPFAREIDRKYEEGYLNAVSIGWIDREYDETQRTVTKWELLDISAVPVPGDPDALLRREYAMIRSLLGDEQSQSDRAEGDGADASTTADPVFNSSDPVTTSSGTAEHTRGAIPPHTTAKADEDASWDGPAAVGKCPAEKDALRHMHAWVDSEIDEDTKQAYKLPHHQADGKVVWRGVAAAMARLLQGGTQIPDGDRRGVWNHLERHYRQFDKEAPELRSLGEFGPRLAESAMPYDEWDRYRADLATVVLAKALELKDAIEQLEAATGPDGPVDESAPSDDAAEALSAIAEVLKEIEP